MPVNPMMQTQDTFVNPLLTQISVLFHQQINPILPRIFKPITVDTQSGHYYKWPRGTFFRSEIERAAPGARPPRVAVNRQLDTYQCDLYHVAYDIPDMLRYNQQGGNSRIDLEKTATFTVTDNLVRGLDDLFFAGYFKTGVWGQDYTGVASSPSASQFIQFDQAGSNPITVVQQILLARLRATGVKLNTVVMDPGVYLEIINHSLVKEQIKYVSRTIIGETLTPELLAQMWGVKEVIIADGILSRHNDVDDDNPGVGTAGMEFMGARYSTRGMLLAYVPDSPAEDQPAAGYSFRWRYGGTANDNGVRIVDWRSEETSTMTIKAEAALGMKQVSPECGVFLTNCISY